MSKKKRKGREGELEEKKISTMIERRSFSILQKKHTQGEDFQKTVPT